MSVKGSEVCATCRIRPVPPSRSVCYECYPETEHEADLRRLVLRSEAEARLRREKDEEEAFPHLAELREVVAERDRLLAELASLRGTWSSKPPDCAGAWWHRSTPDDKPRVREVKEWPADNCLVAYSERDDECKMVADIGGQWQRCQPPGEGVKS